MDTGISPPQAQPTGALTPEPDKSGSRSRWLNILALIAGLAASALGPLVGGLFILLSLRGRPVADALSVTTIGLSMAALGLGFGGALAWAGYQGLRGRLSRPFRPGIKWFWGSLAGLGLALMIGQAILSFDLLAPVVFPPFHVLAIALPAILVPVLVGQGVKHNIRAPTQRQVIGQMALGAFGTTAIAFALEVVVAVVGLIFVGVVIALTPGGVAQLAELQAMLADPARLQDTHMLVRWLLKPEVLFSGVVMVVIVVPLIEEMAKSVGVPLLTLWTRETPSPAQGWLWGIAVGAGFAITEGLFNSAASLPFWVGIVLLRVGATLMHVVTAGLTGLAWAQALASRRPLLLLGGYVTSMALHGLWNGLTVLMVVSSLWIMARPGDPVSMAGGGLGVLVGLVGLVLVALAPIGVVAYITLRVREQQA